MNLGSSVSLLRCRDVVQTFGNRDVLSGVELSVAPAEIVAIAGASGSGKSTLLHILSGLRLPSSGYVQWGDDERDVCGLKEPEMTLNRRRYCSFVFQFPVFLEDLSVRENVALPMVIAGWRSRMALRRADACLSPLGMSDFAMATPSELSGGEMQRVSIARAFVSEPRVIFADEPTGSLDDKNSDMVMSAFVHLAQQFRKTVVVVTHDAGVMRKASRVLWLRNGVLSEDRPSR